MSKMMTLADLKARDGNNNSESWGFNVARQPNKNGCLQCLETVFPHFKINSINFLFVIICIGMFILTKVMDSTVMGNSSDDQGKWVCTLRAFQAKYTYDIVKKFQVWRLLTATFLHNGPMHLFWNMFSLLMIGFQVEDAVQSSKNFLILLILSSYQGNVLSAIFKPYTVGVGASCTIFALLGVLAIWFWLNYHRLGQNKNIFLIFFILIGIFSVMNFFSSTNIDMYGHLGGFLAGVPLGILFIRTTDNDDLRKLDKWRKVCRIFLVLLLAISTVLMFVKPLPGCANNVCDNNCKF